MSTVDPKLIAVQVARIAFDLATGDRADAAQAAKEIANLVVDLVPVDEWKQFLTARDKTWADAATDIAEEIKLDT